MNDLERRAYTWAKHWHLGQKRKYTGHAYISHPVAVANIVRTVEHTPEMIAAAFMHDTLEDTDATADEMLREFGDVVFKYVLWLTDAKWPAIHRPNREMRKAFDRLRLGGAPPQVKTIKIADLIDNSSSIVQYDPDFAVTYIKEKRLLLDECLKEGDATLWARADAIVREAEEVKLAEWFKSKGAR